MFRVFHDSQRVSRLKRDIRRFAEETAYDDKEDSADPHVSGKHRGYIKRKKRARLIRG